MNIIDYVKQYGDDTFEERAFNAVDAFVFASMGFIKFESKNIIPSYKEPNKKIYMHEIPEEYIDEISLDYLNAINNATLLRLLKTKRRYKDISLQYQFSVIDELLTEQIYAITLELPYAGHFILFRGTDATKIGWEENMLALTKPVSAAQLDAVEYLNIVHRIIGDKPLMIGGHSKGGTLTFYSAVFVEKSIQDLITKAYYFEGPGLPYRFYEKEAYKRIEDRIVNIVPRDSIIGEFFYSPKKPLVVYALGKGFMQHDQYHWQVNGDDFEYVDQRNPNTRVIHRLSKLLLKTKDKENINNIIKLFGIFTLIDGQENLISLEITPRKAIKRFKLFQKEMKFKERIRLYIFIRRILKMYKDSDKYYKQKDKENKN